MINYHLLSIENYINALVNLISSFEGHIPQVKDIGDGMATIGYGYTFNRSNNLALWTAAGIALTDSERTALQNIDNASNIEKTNIALTQFTRNLTKDEACQLLKQTYQQYESPADELGMPISSERVAFVSLTYNRGVDAVHKKMKAFYAAVQADNRAEAWFQIRYRSQTTNPKYVNGIANRRYSEAQMFGLYDSGVMTGEEAKEVLRMYTIHKIEIGAYESKYTPPATIKLEIGTAVIYLNMNFAQGTNIDGEIIVGKGLDSYAYTSDEKNNPNDAILLGTANNDLIFGEAGHDGIIGIHLEYLINNLIKNNSMILMILRRAA